MLWIQKLIAGEQRDLRSLIRQMKPSPSDLPPLNTDLPSRLEELRERMHRHYGISVEMHCEEAGARMPIPLMQELYFIIHEALANAARHANASAVAVDLAIKADQVSIKVTDNGKGFPFHGRFDHAGLFRMKIGPATLKERIDGIEAMEKVRRLRPDILVLDIRMPGKDRSSGR